MIPNRRSAQQKVAGFSDKIMRRKNEFRPRQPAEVPDIIINRASGKKQGTGYGTGT
jgi:hypothetical protein